MQMIMICDIINKFSTTRINQNRSEIFYSLCFCLDVFLLCNIRIYVVIGSQVGRVGNEIYIYIYICIYIYNEFSKYFFRNILFQKQSKANGECAIHQDLMELYWRIAFPLTFRVKNQLNYVTNGGEKAICSCISAQLLF